MIAHFIQRRIIASLLLAAVPSSMMPAAAEVVCGAHPQTLVVANCDRLGAGSGM